MAKFLMGTIVGSILTLAATTIFAGLLSSPAERQLIENWRKVRPGMEKSAVIELLGEPSYEMKLGEGFPAWAEKSVPPEYYKTHGLLVFTVRMTGPQLLLIFIDAEGCVSFVSSTYT